MYASVTDRGYEGSCVGGSGAILIPSRFVWRHEGRRVFLTGSFTRWSEHIPMSPMEGCPSVFQVICSLMPGYHQYKFNVDGEWWHDIELPIVSGTYGVVNTIYVVREPDILPAILSAETPSRSHMEVDNDVFGHADIAVSPGLLFLTVTTAMAQNVPTKRAVLVGTEYYLDNRKLRGCAGDAIKMRDALISVTMGSIFNIRS
ncbi:AMP-activated serine/threonine-protein kinase regulatory subunit [Trifolium repens]|nr:AMP-activated serine/threonine-protein kinase regulatory subunit [Trifolium repens]